MEVNVYNIKGEDTGRKMCIRDRSIGEPGTQLTLRTFHAGGTAANIAANASITAKNPARLEFEELRTVDAVSYTHLLQRNLILLFIMSVMW